MDFIVAHFRSGIKPFAKVSFFAVLFFPLCLYGCAPKIFLKPPKPDISQILEFLKNRESDLKSFRGVGIFKTVRRTSARTFRMVWIGSQPQDLRVEILGPWGQPTAAFVMSDSRFFFHSRRDNRYFKGDVTMGKLSRFVSIPVKAEELFALLSGLPPILKFHHAKIRVSRANGGWLLSLYEKWGRLIEKLWLSDDTKTVERVEVFDRWGDLRYRVAFSEFREAESFRLPHRIAISDTEGPVWSLAVERFWTNVSIPEEAYTLEIPGGAQVRVVD